MQAVTTKRVLHSRSRASKRASAAARSLAMRWRSVADAALDAVDAVTDAAERPASPAAAAAAHATVSNARQAMARCARRVVNILVR